MTLSTTRTSDVEAPRAAVRPMGLLREPVSGLTHLVGAVAALAGTIALLDAADGPTRHLVAFAVYGASLVLLLGASAAYHLVRVAPPTLRILRTLDHLSIFALIAGTYTPICLVPLYGPWGITLVSVLWGTVALGVFVSLFWLDAPRFVTVGIYLVMGWAGVVALGPAVRLVPAATLWLILAGGLAYSVGAIVYARRRPDPLPGVFGFHEIWHLFVLAGAGCHFVAVWGLVGYPAG